MYLVGERKLLLPVIHSLLYTSTAAANKLVGRTNSKQTATLPACLMAIESCPKANLIDILSDMLRR